MSKKIHRLFSAVLALCVAFSLLCVPALAAGTTGAKDAPWDISANGADTVSAWYEGDEQTGFTLHITGSGSMTASFQNTAAPWAGIKENITTVVVDKGVTNVGAYAFNYCRRLSSVSLPESLTEIGTYAFHATSVKRLTIPAGVNTIGRMIATPNTYYEVLGNPTTVDDHAFSTSLVSTKDRDTAEALNGKTNVSALIVLDGGVYGETDDDLANLSYGLIAPTKEGYKFQGWYRDAAFNNACAKSSDGRWIVNINNIYYAKWSDGTSENDPGKDDPGKDDPGKDDPGKDDPGKDDPGKDDPGKDDPGKDNPGEDNPGTDGPGTNDPGTGGPGTTTHPGTSTPSTDSTTVTDVTQNPDGSTTTTVTDTKTGESIATTVYPDGTTKVVETKATGAVTTTITDPDGGKIVNEKAPNSDVAITVSNPEGEVLVDMAVPAHIPTVDNDFTDVPSGHYAENAINQAVAMGLINGVGDGKFGTNTYIDRAMAATILFRLAGMEGESYPNSFADVPDGYYAENGIAWASKAGVVNGVGDGEFAPGNEIKRQDLAVILYRFANLIGVDTNSGSAAVLDTFQDSGSISSYAREAMAWCVNNGILNGKGDGIIDPAASTKRCDAMLMFQRFMNLIKGGV